MRLSVFLSNFLFFLFLSFRFGIKIDQLRWAAQVYS
jgi:hypothetical protein